MKSGSEPLDSIPGVGKSLARTLRLIGIETVRDLKGGDPERLCRKLVRALGTRVDRCVLYVFRCAVYYAGRRRHDPAKLRWRHWKDRPG